ncbi:hypothetical protein BCR35DRAFT_307431 [Leucosporidium creatinivorum]|uniref:F-box domain-containing protein n=1 Tax=Leucosporidium creatinivorum TaxID=106004 RepID=A0A1Y2ENX5_9BASI|nr:hypothetical protein BCR35DRAFT_307431 [Leucosporidium creatinivorum]
MEEPDGSYLEPVDVAAILHALPQLVEVELRGVNSKDGAALAIRALRHLPKLQKLKMADGDALVHRSLGQPWSSSLTSLNLDRSELIHLPVLQALLEQHSSTLHLLSLPLLPHYPDFPHFSLPHLEELRLWTTETSAPLLRSFSDSPLRRLRVKMYVEGDPIKMEVEAVLKTVQHHGGTLKRVRVTARAFNAAEQDEQEVLDRLEALCLKQGIKYQYELESP